MMSAKRILNIASTVVVLFFFITQACAKKNVQTAPEPVPPGFYIARQEMASDQEQPAAPRAASAPKAPYRENVPSDPGSSKTDRLMIYNAQFTVIVDNISGTLDKIRKSAELLQGYMQSMDARSIVIKVPAANFNKIIKKIERLGEVTHKEITGSDVTEEMRDLTIRLKSAEALHKRFVGLLAKAVNVEDIIKIETELSRVTQTIETLKGKIRYLENQIAYSTLTVNLNSPLPQQVIKERIPFPWVRELGKDISRGNTAYYNVCSYCRSPKFNLPDAFAKYIEVKDLVRATSADGVLIKVARHDNVDGASPEFWTDLVKRALAIEQVIAVKSTTDLAINKKVKAHVMQGKKEIGNKTYDYLIAVVMTKKHVYTYEAWGRTDAFQPRKKAIMDSIKTLSVTCWGLSR